MKKKLIVIGGLLIGLLGGQCAYAQGAAQSDDLAISLSTDSTSYSGYNSSGVVKPYIWHTSQSTTIDSGAVEVTVLLPLGLEFDTTSMAWLPTGWRFVYEDKWSAKLYNTTVLAPFPTWMEQEFDIPFKITGPVNNQTISVQVAFQGLIGLGYQDSDGSNDAASIGVTVANTPLSVDFSSFVAEANGCNANLTWTTASESDNAYFAVERSFDGKSFKAIGRVTAKTEGFHGERNYAFTDETPSKGTNFYRIRQYDVNGRSTISKVAEVTMNCDINNISLYPNPTKGVVYVEGLVGANTVEVYNVLGQVVLRKEGSATTEMLDISKLASGSYTVRVLRNDATVFTAKVVKN